MPDGDWRTGLLAGVALSAADPGDRNPIGWPGYRPRAALSWGPGELGGHPIVAVSFDFEVLGGSFGEADATGFGSACALAADGGLPLVSVARSGGTRLQEGMAALVGIPRAALALERLAAARVPHLSVADHPTTGGVWIAVVSAADLRIGVAGATVGFSGPRVTEALTGEIPPAGSHTAEAAHRAGLLDAVCSGDQVAGWLTRALDALAPGTGPAGAPPADHDPPARGGWAQVRHARDANRPAGAALLRRLLGGTVELAGADTTVTAVLGRTAGGRPVIGVAVATDRGGRPTPAGYALLGRAARLADRLDRPLLTLVDTPGADPGADSEAAGIAPRIAEALAGVLGCRSPTLAVVHGEGGSGGALAAAACDEVLVTDTGYFTALAPEGAASALHLDPAAAADAAGLTPAALRQLGFGRPVATGPLPQTVAAILDRLAGQPGPDRLAGRQRRWSQPLPGTLTGA
ncbi:MAG TPA: carboxyl transferase domain-containing protein [Mycobacteriales bacterium]|nr:carboxyl transferase domain-containing protein [Mycobacteriales bacterium]